LLRLSLREGVLMRAAVYLDDVDVLGTDDTGGARKVVARMVSDYGWLVFLGGEHPWPQPDLFREALVRPVALAVPDATLRRTIWANLLEQHGADPAPAGRLAQRFRLTPGRIAGAVAAAALEAAARDAGGGPDEAELERACRRLSSHRLGDVASKIEPRATWDDLVLPDDGVRQLREACDQVRHHHDVFASWGFGRKVSRSLGLSVLFSGPPGTGKTLAAEVLAGELALDLYKIDLSAVVSKYIGETEKNLSAIFREAEASNSILFFDEADALFGKRTEVADAHDRYANIETSFLLQRMEAYDGIVVLATNLRENMDDAFTRRIRFVVDFPFPDQASRRRIWETHFPIEAPVGADVDLDYLARELKVAGGSIRNIVVNAAFLAAANGRVIDMGHLRHATRREFAKIGKLWDDDALVKGATHA
jgi:AAA+ superfamily predicted ATPase